MSERVLVSWEMLRQVPQSCGIPSHDGTQHDRSEEEEVICNNRHLSAGHGAIPRRQASCPTIPDEDVGQTANDGKRGGPSSPRLSVFANASTRQADATAPPSAACKLTSVGKWRQGGRVARCLRKFSCVPRRMVVTARLSRFYGVFGGFVPVRPRWCEGISVIPARPLLWV